MSTSTILSHLDFIFPVVSSSVTWSLSLTLVSLATTLLLWRRRWWLGGRKVANGALKTRLPGPKVNGLITNVVPMISIFRNKVASNRAMFFQVVCGYSHVFHKEGMWLFYGGVKKVLILYRAHTVEPVLNSSDILSKGFEYDFVSPMLKEGLLTSKRDKWRVRRKLLTPSFHFRILDEFIPVFNEQANIFAAKIAKLMEKGEKWVDIGPLASLCTLDIICETAMGKKINSQANSDSPYVHALHQFCSMAIERLLRPWVWPDFIYYRTKQGKQFRKNLKIMDEFTRGVIQERKADKLKQGLQVNGKSSKDDVMLRKRLVLMDLLLDLHLKDETAFTLEDVAEEVDNFMFAGHDTTSSGLSFAIYMLGLHPEIQKKAQQEVDDVMGDDLTRPLTLEHIKELKYIDCVLKETRRLWPPTPFIARDLEEDAVIDGHLVPKGTSCGILIHMLHRDPEVFPNPEVFDPDRFRLDNSVGRHPFAYVPFSAGPRNCIGQRFATFEAITVLSTILRHFEFRSLDPLDKIHIVDDLVLRTEQPLRIAFKPRATTHAEEQ